jgi:hypothetical protein
VTLSRPSVGNVSATYTTGNSTATAGSDYSAQVGTVTFAPGSTSQTITVSVLGDETPENTEQFVVTLSSPVNATIDNSQALGRILDDDTRTISIQDTTVIEADTGGTTNAVFTVRCPRRRSDPDRELRHRQRERDRGQRLHRNLRHPHVRAGTTSQTITVTILGDATAETDETFSVSLTAPVDATLDNTSATGRIFDDDTAGVRMAIDDRAIVEGDAGTKNLVFTVSLSGPSATPVTVQFLTTPSGAVAPSDYTSVAGNRQLRPECDGPDDHGTDHRRCHTRVRRGLLRQPSSPINATLIDNSATGTIFDDDSSRDLFINDALIVEGDSGHHEPRLHGRHVGHRSAAGDGPVHRRPTARAIAPNDFVADHRRDHLRPGDDQPDPHGGNRRRPGERAHRVAHRHPD